MKMKRAILTLYVLAGLVVATPVFGQTVIQHLGAMDPMDEGFTLAAAGEPQLGPVFGDSGFDAWIIRSRSHNEDASYRYFLTPAEQDLASNYDWTFSANFRFVEASDYARVVMSVHTGTIGFRLVVSAINEGEIVVSGTGGIPTFSLVGDALAYHEYQFVYDAASEMAALWIDGVEWVTDIFGGQISPSGAVAFGATGESITYSHWNEVTLAIVPEPATVAFLSGLGALFLVTYVHRRRRNASLEA